MNRFRKHIALVLFLLFSFMQIAELHVFEHDDTAHDCVLCDFSSEKKEYDYLITPTLGVPEYIAILIPRSTKFYNVEHYFQNTITSLNNKAPPIS